MFNRNDFQDVAEVLRDARRAKVLAVPACQDLTLRFGGLFKMRNRSFNLERFAGVVYENDIAPQAVQDVITNATTKA